MSQVNYTTITPNRERGQHLKFEDRVSIKIFRKLGYSLRAIGQVLSCSASTVKYELDRGTGSRKGQKGRHPEYSAKRGQAIYEVNRSRCHKQHKLTSENPFVKWVCNQVINHKWSFDACVGYAKINNLFNKQDIVCTKTLYNELWAGNLMLTPFDLPEALGRKTKKKNNTAKNKRIYGKSIEQRDDKVNLRIECGHWEIDTVVGRKAGKESVVLTIVEKKTQYYIAIKIPGKDSKSVIAALEVLRQEYGIEKFSQVFKTITADNGSEFEALSQIESWGTKVYFAHPYSSWERAQNERHNRIFRRYVAKRTSIENYTAQQILYYADEINALPRRQLGYSTPEELFDKFLDGVYCIVNVS